MKNNSVNDADIDSGTKWYEEFPKGEAPYKHTKSEVEVLDLKSEAKKYLDAETAAFQLKQSKSRDSEILWLKTALSRGTSSDKIAASVVLIQDNPKYNLSRLLSIVSQVRAAKQNQCIAVIKSLQDLFLSDLLHPNFKLLKFEEQDLDSLVNIDTLNNKKNKSQLEIERKKLLAHWYFEDQLREQYERFVTSLSTIASDTVDTNREKAVVAMAELLTANCEQEQKLLEFLVNKIGDPSSKVASKTVFSLGKVLEEHPNMKLIVLREVEKLLFRKNVAQRAQYYAICLLTQMVLDREDKEIATNLIDVYFAFFKACLKRGEPDSRMMGAILTGVNRAYPFSNMDTNNLRNHIDSVYKVVHVGSFNVSLNALSLLHQVVSKDSTQADRFYSAFYRKLMDPQIGVSNKRAVFLNLLFRVLRSDPSVIRFHAFIKRVLQVLMYFPANMACATLYVVSKVLQVRKDAKQILGPLSARVKAEPASEFESSDVTTEPSLSKMKTHLENDNDVKIMTEVNPAIDSIMLSNLKVEAAGKEKHGKDIGMADSVKEEKDNIQFYDPFARNPLRAGAYHGSSCAELLALTSHFHPSVALFATTIIQGKPIDYSGDPLEDLTLIRFLDRYVFKNPKKLEKKKVVKKNDPLAHRAAYTPKGMRSIPVDSMAYINEREERIPVDELFLYSYLKNKNELRNGEYFKKEKEEDEDNESVNSEEFNLMLDNLGKEKDFDELDIAGDFESTKINRKKIVDESDDEDEEEDEEDDEDDVDEDLMDGESDVDLEDVNETDEDGLDDLMEMDDIDDEDLSDIDFNDSDDEDGVEKEMLRSKANSFKKSSKDTGKNSKKKSKGLDENVFMSAEKFAEMLEEQGRSKLKHGGTSELSNADGASNKQLDWEMGRDQRLKGNYNRNKRKGAVASKKRKGVKRFKR